MECAAIDPAAKLQGSRIKDCLRASLRVLDDSSVWHSSLQHFSVNAKQLERSVFQAEPSRCESGDGGHCRRGTRNRETAICWCSAFPVPRSAFHLLSRCKRTARLPAKEKARGANPRESANLWWSWCNSSITPCDGVGDGANPFGHPNFNNCLQAGVSFAATTWRALRKVHPRLCIAL